jgi:hypothetical protein
VISPLLRPLPDNTQNSQQTDIHAPRGIRTHDPSKRAAADPRLRPRGHWDQRLNKHGHYFECGPQTFLFSWFGPRAQKLAHLEPTHCKYRHKTHKGKFATSHMSPVACLSVSPCTVLAKDCVPVYMRVRMPRSLDCLLIYWTKPQGDDGNRWHSTGIEVCVQYWLPLNRICCFISVRFAKTRHLHTPYDFSERTGIITVNRIHRLVHSWRRAVASIDILAPGVDNHNDRP